MSTRIFYAYMFKEHAKFSDIYEAQKWLNELKKQFIKWVPTDMIRWDSMMKLDYFERIKRLQDDTKKPEKGGVWDYQLQAVVFCRTIGRTNYIAIQFFPSNAAVKFLNKYVKLKEFWYQNQTDDGFDLPDWHKREKFWNAVYDEFWVASEAGLCYDIYDGTNFMTSDEIIRELEHLEKQQNKT